MTKIKFKLPPEILQRLSPVSDKSARKRLNSFARTRLLDKGFSVAEVLAVLDQEIKIQTETAQDDRSLAGSLTDDDDETESEQLTDGEGLAADPVPLLMTGSGDFCTIDRNSAGTATEAVLLLEARNIKESSVKAEPADSRVIHAADRTPAAVETDTIGSTEPLPDRSGRIGDLLVNDQPPEDIDRTPARLLTEKGTVVHEDSERHDNVIPFPEPFARPIVSSKSPTTDPVPAKAGKLWDGLSRAAEGFRRVHSTRYGIFKLVCYAALIPASSQSVLAFFNGLDLYGSLLWNKIFAYGLTAAVDLLAIDMFTRGVQEARVKFRRWRTILLLAGALLVIGSNVMLARQNMKNDANIDSTAKALSKWESDLAKKDQALVDAKSAASKAMGAYLAAKWRGNPDPSACESGAVTDCKGPYSSAAMDAQADSIAKALDVKNADAAVETFKFTKPAGNTAGTAAITEGVLSLRQWFYMALWGLIILASLAAPHPALLRPSPV